MNAITVPSYMQNMMPALPPEMRQYLSTHFAAAYESFNSQFNTLSVKGFQFRQLMGGKEVASRRDHLDCVILAIAPENHHTYYSKQFRDEEGIKPDAVWGQNDPVPANVPASALQKDENGRNKFQIKRRSVIAIFDQNNNLDLENLYVFDIGSMSLFGDDLQTPGVGLGKACTLNSYIQLLKNTGIFACAIPTRIIFNTGAGVPTVRFIPHVTQTGDWVFFPTELMHRVFTVVQSQKCQDLVNWRKSVTTQEEAPVPPTQAAPIHQAPAPMAAPQPMPAQAAPVYTPAQPVMQPMMPAMTSAPVMTMGQAPMPQPNTAPLAAQMTQAVQQAQQHAAQAMPVAQAAPVVEDIQGFDDITAAVAALSDKKFD